MAGRIRGWDNAIVRAMFHVRGHGLPCPYTMNHARKQVAHKARGKVKVTVRGQF